MAGFFVVAVEGEQRYTTYYEDDADGEADQAHSTHGTDKKNTDAEND